MTQPIWRKLFYAVALVATAALLFRLVEDHLLPTPSLETASEPLTASTGPMAPPTPLSTTPSTASVPPSTSSNRKIAQATANSSTSKKVRKTSVKASTEAEATSSISTETPPTETRVPEKTTLTIEKIHIVGNTIFDEATLSEIAAPFEGRELNDEDLVDLRLRLTRHYVDAGYINSGAIIPERTTVDGVLLVKIIEGRLSAVNVSGQHHYQSWYLPQLIAGDTRHPLNVSQLQENMQLLLQDGIVQVINAQLAPGDAQGQAIVNADVREGPRFKAGLTISNDHPPSIGETGGTLDLSARNLLGINDLTSASIGLTRGYISYGLQENLPLSVPSLSAFLRVGRNNGNIIESSISELDITSRGSYAELGFSDQIIRSLKQNLIASLSLSYTDTTTKLLGIPFSFTPGVERGRSKVTSIRTAVDWVFRQTEQVFAARTALNFGIPIFGATFHDESELPDTRFVTWSGQFQFVRQVFDRSGELIGRANFQLSSSSLLPSEKTTIGGIDTVRGYSINTLVRDEGAAASLEYRHTVYRLFIPGISEKASDGAVALAAFYDLGTAAEHSHSHTFISGTGVGVRWDPAQNFSAVIYKGFALQNIASESNSLQDRGIYFRVNYETGF